MFIVFACRPANMHWQFFLVTDGILFKKRCSRVSFFAVVQDRDVSAAREVGIGEKLAIKHLSSMAQQFEAALASTAEGLAGNGFANTAQLREQILLTGGYRHIAK